MANKYLSNVCIDHTPYMISSSFLDLLGASTSADCQRILYQRGDGAVQKGEEEETEKKSACES